MENRNLAAIDIGSNGARLLIKNVKEDTMGNVVVILCNINQFVRVITSFISTSFNISFLAHCLFHPLCCYYMRTHQNTVLQLPFLL